MHCKLRAAQLFVITGATVVFSYSVLAEEAEKDAAKGWRTFCLLTAQNVTIAEQSVLEKKTQFIRHEHPVFEHKNPFGRDERGLVFLWKQKNGRPVAVFSSLLIRRSDEPELWNEIFEYHSLHDKPIEGSFGDQRHIPERDYRQALAWRPKKPGLDWKQVPNAPKPAPTAPRIRLQARELVRRFKCDGKFGRAEELYHLRALAKPAYEYQFKQGEQLVGGVLTFYCRATDPEAILALEIRKTDSGELAWHYGCANFTRAGITFFLDDKEVWAEQSYQYPGLFFNPEYKHYGNFPVQRFTIQQGIVRQRAQLERLEKARKTLGESKR